MTTVAKTSEPTPVDTDPTVDESAPTVDHLTPVLNEVDAEVAADGAGPAEPAPDAPWQPDAVDRPRGAVPFTIRDRLMYAKPVTRWPSSAMKVFNTGLSTFYVWAETCLLPESLVIWQQLDPEWGEFLAARDAWVDSTQVDPGK